MKPLMKKDERGAIIVEATLALAIFSFAIFTLLWVISISYIQARVGTALASSTKEISQYSYLYYKFNLDTMQSNAADKAAKTKETMEETIKGIGILSDSLSDVVEDAKTADFTAMYEDAKTGAKQVESLIAIYEPILKEPKQFVLGMANLAISQALEEGKNMLGQLMCYAFIRKNLVESSSDDADRFLRRYKVKDGLGGLNFNGSSLMAEGKSDEIQMVVTYEIEVVKLFGIDITYTICQCAKSAAWGNGISQIKKP